MNRPTLLLFDIDGTLVAAGGAGRRGLERAFDAYCQRADACDAIRFAGMTDPLIIQEALAGLGLPFSHEVCDAILSLYIEFLIEELQRSDTYQVLPGVRTLLHSLAQRPDYAIGLGTGNIEAGARAKLEPAQLNHHFTFGGFGSDHMDRAELIRRGAERGAARLGRPLSDCRTLIIGDTPRDIAAAHAIGAQCLAVTTGNYTTDALTEAEWIVPHLGDPVALDVLLGR